MKNLKINITVAVILSVIISLYICQKHYKTVKVPSKTSHNLKAELGRNVFFDKGLSNPVGQSCSSCHAPSAGFSDSTHAVVSKGVVAGLFGNRNAPIVGYTMFNPAFHFDKADSSYHGGLFLDGRVNSLEEQVEKPFLNKVEMNNNDVAMVVSKLKSASYFPLFKQLYGDTSDIKTTFNHIADALATFERSPEVNPLTSKFDFYLKGEASLTAEELSGLRLFNDTSRAMCSKCHLTTPDPQSGKILFTDFTYNNNNGTRKNPNSPFYKIPQAFNAAGANYIDKGLGDILHDHHHDGEFRVSSLRNIAITAPYFHNGVFNTLEEVVHFYNTRDVPGSGFEPPEVAVHIDTLETGNLHLTLQEEKDIVAFMKTLTDGYK
jgi:cytochrome c peroxidase